MDRQSEQKNNLKQVLTVLEDVMKLVKDLIDLDGYDDESLITLRSNVEACIGVLGYEVNLILIPEKKS